MKQRNTFVIIWLKGTGTENLVVYEHYLHFELRATTEFGVLLLNQCAYCSFFHCHIMFISPAFKLNSYLDIQKQQWLQ